MHIDEDEIASKFAEVFRADGANDGKTRSVMNFIRDDLASDTSVIVSNSNESVELLILSIDT